MSARLGCGTERNAPPRANNPMSIRELGMPQVSSSETFLSLPLLESIKARPGVSTAIPPRTGSEMVGSAWGSGLRLAASWT